MSNFSPEDLVKNLAASRELSREFHDFAISPVRDRILRMARRNLKNILKDCNISVLLRRKSLLVQPKSSVLLRALLNGGTIKELNAIARNLGFLSLEICYDNINLEVNTFMSKDYIKIAPADGRNRDLAIRCFECEYSCSIVEVKNSICWLTNQEPTFKFTNLDPSQYLGKRVDDLWIPEETERLYKYLNRDGSVDNFEYDGYRKIDVLQGLFIPKRFSASFELVEYMGRLCRLGEFKFK